MLIEFLKQTDTDDRLFVALKFESKDVAKEILNRYSKRCCPLCVVVLFDVLD